MLTGITEYNPNFTSVRLDRLKYRDLRYINRIIKLSDEQGFDVWLSMGSNNTYVARITKSSGRGFDYQGNGSTKQPDKKDPKSCSLALRRAFFEAYENYKKDQNFAKRYLLTTSL